MKWSKSSGLREIYSLTCLYRKWRKISNSLTWLLKELEKKKNKLNRKTEDRIKIRAKIDIKKIEK